MRRVIGFCMNMRPPAMRAIALAIKIFYLGVKNTFTFLKTGPTEHG
jgi:hypothetical protein